MIIFVGINGVHKFVWGAYKKAIKAKKCVSVCMTHYINAFFTLITEFFEIIIGIICASFTTHIWKKILFFIFVEMLNPDLKSKKKAKNTKL